MVATEEKVRRKWYSGPLTPTIPAAVSVPSTDPTATPSSPDNLTMPGRSVIQPHPPMAVLEETVAVLCRVASSFLRFSHLELFAKKNEGKLLIQLANHLLEREFPHLLKEDVEQEGGQEKQETVSPKIYIDMFREIVKCNMQLVAEWTRVGYCQVGWE